MFNLIRHAILKGNVVVNVIAYETIQTGCPEGLEDVIAIASDEGQIGWVYANGTFTNPNPPVIVEIPAILTPTPEELMAQLNAIQAQIMARYPKEVV
jgi:hypothetical protein